MKCNVCFGQDVMEEYRVESPEPTTSKEPLCPVIEVEEVEEQNLYEHVALKPLEIIVEENSDLSDGESKMIVEIVKTPKRKKRNRFRKKKEREAPSCFLLDAKIIEKPVEFRSVCTTDVLDSEMEVEIINLDTISTSSSSHDLSDDDVLDDNELEMNINNEPEPLQALCEKVMKKFTAFDTENNLEQKNDDRDDRDRESKIKYTIRERVILINRNKLIMPDDDVVGGNYEQSPSKNLVESELSIDERREVDPDQSVECNNNNKNNYDEQLTHRLNELVMKEIVDAIAIKSNDNSNNNESSEKSVLFKYFTANKSLDVEEKEENLNENENEKQQQQDEKQNSKIECCDYEISQDHVEENIDSVLETELDQIKVREQELQFEYDNLELERAKLEEELKLIGVQSQLAEEATYYVSKQNDFVEHKQKKLSPPQKDIPKPPKNKMYSEWQQKVEEREARKLHKVIKITKTNEVKLKNQEVDEDNVNDEFIRKVKERRRKFTIPSDSDYDSAPDNQSSLPKHLNEFLEFGGDTKIEKEEQEKEIKKGKEGESRPATSFLGVICAAGFIFWSIYRFLK